MTHRQTPRPTHRCTQPFTPFGAVWRFAVALWRRLGAPSRAPLLCWLHGQAGPVLPGGVASAGLVTVLAGSFAVSVIGVIGLWSGAGADHDVTRHLRYHGAQQPPALQSPSAASLSLLFATSDAALTPRSDQVTPRVVPQHAAAALRRLQCVPHRVCRHSARAESVCGPLQPAAHHARTVLRSLTPVPLRFAQLRTGLFVHSERQWKEMLVVVAGMSGQMGKRKED